MSKIRIQQSVKNSSFIYKIIVIVLFLLTCFSSGQTVYAGSGGNSLPNATSIYVFYQDQSTLTQTGGAQNISKSYSLQGEFEFYGYYPFNSAYFTDSNAIVIGDSYYLPSQYFEDIFNIFYLNSFFTDSRTVRLTGTTSDGTNSNILLTLVFDGDLVYVTGSITPPDPSGYTYQLNAVAQRRYGGGTGTPDNPFLINTPEHMNTIGQKPKDWDNSFKLTQDIDLSEFKLEQFNIIGYFNSDSDNLPFSGTFDGNNKRIIHFTYVTSNMSRVGLFGYLNGEKLLIKRLGIIEPNIISNNGDYIGALAGQLENGSILNCYVTGGRISGVGSVGGLIGLNGEILPLTNMDEIARKAGIIMNCTSTTSVSGNNNVGGLAGSNLNYIIDCNSNATVNGYCQIGGLAGYNNGSIIDSHAGGNITGQLYIGGCVGRNYWHITNCFSTASVNVQYGYAGGLTGANEADGIIKNSYSNGSARGLFNIGGLLGYNDGIVMDCYSSAAVTDSNTSDNVTIGFGGLIGDRTDKACAFLSFWDTQASGQQNSAGGIGKTTADMKTKSTFIDWGKGSIITNWTIMQNPVKEYPRLLWENAGGEAILPVDINDLLTGSGTLQDPYLISTADNFNTLGLFPYEWDKHFQLQANINMSAFSNQKFNMIGFYRLPFTGTFEGNNHVISNLTFNSPQQSYVGLFGCISSLIAQVQNLGLTNIIIDAKNNVGSLAGCAKEGTIKNCYSQNSDITGNQFVAGLVGFNQVTISNSYSTGTVNGYTDVGGLVGSNSEGTIENCHSESDVSGDSDVGGLTGSNSGSIKSGVTTCSITANSLVGGIAGYNTGSIDNSHSSGYMSGYEKIGGLAGSNNGVVKNSYSSANVNGDFEVGGLTGFNLDATITNCYATGNVYGRLAAGGLAGQCSGQTSITNSYANNSVAGYESIGGLVGRNESSISKSYSRGIVSGTMEVGGLVGWNLNSSSISNSYSRCSVLAGQWGGGLVGINSGSISKCYSSGIVTGTKLTIGGLVALNYSTVSASFWDMETSGQTTSSGGTGKTTANMKAKNNYTSAGWDFTSTWKITENLDYPKLTWEAN